MTPTGFTPAMQRRHPGLREPWRPTLGGVVAVACLLAALMLGAALLLQLIHI